MVALARRQGDGGYIKQAAIVADLLRTVAPLPANRTLLEAIRSSSILVVDDNASNRDVLERRLTQKGHKVVTAANGTSALDLVTTQEFDLILLDLIRRK
jgi:PleD family two-component response regulator